MKVAANGLMIEVDDRGPPNGEPLLLVMGLGMQLLGWPEPFVQVLVARGFRVIRFDNRDVGLSSFFDAAGKPSMAAAMARYALHLPVPSVYTLADMADDAAGVLDALGLESAHVCGASMGGMIAQHFAVRHARRLRSLGLMMTTTGARSLPGPTLAARSVLLTKPQGRDTAAAVAYLERLLHVIGSPAFPPPPEALRARLTEMVERSWHPVGSLRQLIAIAADGDRSALAARIRAPTLVLHGEADPLVRVAAGRQLARVIPDAELQTIAGMGHDLPPQLFDRFADALRGVADRWRSDTAHAGAGSGAGLGAGSGAGAGAGAGAAEAAGPKVAREAPAAGTAAAPGEPVVDASSDPSAARKPGFAA